MRRLVLVLVLVLPLVLAGCGGATHARPREFSVASSAAQLVTQLAASAFPYGDVRFEVVGSHGGFDATHLSVLQETAGAHARRSGHAPTG